MIINIAYKLLDPIHLCNFLFGGGITSRRLLVLRPPVKLHKKVQIFYACERDDNSRGDTLGTEDLGDVVFDNFS